MEFIQFIRNEQLQRDWSGCFRCPLSMLRRKVVFGRGIIGAEIMLIGEAPGKDEDDGGEPFIGRAGDMLNKILASVELDRSKLWITNVCLCRPKSDDPERENRAPVVNEIDSCRPRLIEEIDIVKPKIIVLCGNTPLYWASGLKGISKYRGRLETTIQTPSHIVKDVFATYHPAALFRGSESQIHDKKWDTFRDWQQIKGALLDKTAQDQEQRQETSSTNT
jgi:uracil-DNA glycosylase family 4